MAVVAGVAVLLILKAYMVHTGGGIIIVPGEDGGFLGVYNFDELRALAPAKLLELHLPTLPSAPPPPRAAPALPLLIEKELSATLSRFLISANEACPPA